MAKISLAIDFGCGNVRIFAKGYGLALSEPAIMAVTENKKNYKLKAIGIDAKKMLGKTNDGVLIFAPIADGIVKNVEYASLLLKNLIDKLEFKKSTIFESVICVSCGLTYEQKQDYIKVCKLAGLNKVILVPKIICSAIGMGLTVNTANANLILDIGAGTTDIAVINCNSIIKGSTTNLGGRGMDIAVASFIADAYRLVVGIPTAQKIREEICSLFENDGQSQEIIGLDMDTNLPRSLTVFSSELFSCIEPYYEEITKIIQTTINVCSPEIASDILCSSIYVCGGCAKIPGLERYLSNKLGLDVKIFADNEACIVGAGKLLEMPKELLEISNNL